MIDSELKQRLDAIDNAIDELYGFFGQLSPRLRAMQPAHLRETGVEQVECVDGLLVVRSMPNNNGVAAS